MRPKRILIVYTDAGGGHKANARAIQFVLENRTPHQVTLMNPYKELIADVDLFARLTPYTDEEVYNRFVLAKGWNNLFCLFYYALTLLNIRLGTRESVQRFARCWKQSQFDLVISVMPMSNQGLYRSVRKVFGRGPLPFIVVITDFMESMKYTWFPKEKDYYLVCGTPESYAGALAKPHSPAMVFNTGGLVVHPKFYQSPMADPKAERRKLKLNPDLPTGCVMYGGGGSVRMTGIARLMADIGRPVQMIFLCGRNQALARQLEQMDLPYPHLIRTFTPRVPYYFAVSDFFVGKPGPGAISEALVTGILPVVDAGQVLPQERYNLAWLKKTGKGLVFKGLRELGTLVKDLDLSSIRDRRSPETAANQAVFEFPEIVARVFEDRNRS